ncbi:hypothetical protein N1031_11730 [Herbiconiux moechotypicola]|uniref:Uncharacterized protein n=1 Tax=Herbiconiux moechotypicola TaxID=637393 RepID=A0ABP5QJL9_9MICO|nr:hypothetical protein [Herbiconiux moechotypicola]MCS5730431.1 hypothetical protein [Herbiconiux moechotypicola]
MSRGNPTRTAAIVGFGLIAIGVAHLVITLSIMLGGIVLLFGIVVLVLARRIATRIAKRRSGLADRDLPVLARRIQTGGATVMMFGFGAVSFGLVAILNG